MTEATPNVTTFTEEEFNSPIYKCAETRKVKVFIFSRKIYKQGTMTFVKGEDSGTDPDVTRIMDEFATPMGLGEKDVERFIDFTGENVLTTIGNLSEDKDLKNYDCFFFMFFTFLKRYQEKNEDDSIIRKEGLVFGDGPIDTNDVWDKVKAIPQFHGKPKVFLIQADDMELVRPPQDTGVTVVKKIPIAADRLIIQSTIPANVCTRIDPCDGPSQGSLLVQSFLEVMQDNWTRQDQLDLLALTPEINHKVKTKLKELNEKGRVSHFPYPQVNSTLTKLLYLYKPQ